MSDSVVMVMRWLLPTALFSVFVLCAWVNWWIVWRALISHRHEGSIVPFVGGVCGTLALSILGSIEAAHAISSLVATIKWLPLLVDFGCVPYVLVASWLIVKEKITARKASRD